MVQVFALPLSGEAYFTFNGNLDLFQVHTNWHALISLRRPLNHKPLQGLLLNLVPGADLFVPLRIPKYEVLCIERVCGFMKDVVKDQSIRDQEVFVIRNFELKESGIRIAEVEHFYCARVFDTCA